MFIQVQNQKLKRNNQFRVQTISAALHEFLRLNRRVRHICIAQPLNPRLRHLAGMPRQPLVYAFQLSGRLSKIRLVRSRN